MSGHSVPGRHDALPGVWRTTRGNALAPSQKGKNRLKPAHTCTLGGSLYGIIAQSLSGIVYLRPQIYSPCHDASKVAM